MTRPLLCWSVFPLAALLMLPASLHAETRLIPCRLPSDARFLFTFEEQGWARDGAPWRVSLTRALHLARDGVGYHLVIDPARANGEVNSAMLSRVAAFYDPKDLRPMTVRIDMMGRITGIDALADHWQARLKRFERLVGTMSAGGDAQRARAALTALTNADEATKISQLAGDVAGPLLRLCGQAVTAEKGPDGAFVVVEVKENDALRESAQYHVDPFSGLMQSIERRVVSKMQPNQPQLTSWRFESQL